MDIFDDSRVSRMLRLAYSVRTQELDAVTIHVSPILRSLHWLPVRRRVTVKSAVIAWKCVNGVATTYLRLREICFCPSNVRGRPRLRPASTHCPEFRLLLDSEASHTAVLRCGTVSRQPCTKICHAMAALVEMNVSIQTFTVTHEGHPALLQRFS